MENIAKQWAHTGNLLVLFFHLLFPQVCAAAEPFHLSLYSQRNLEVLQAEYPQYYAKTLQEIEQLKKSYESWEQLPAAENAPLIPHDIHFIWLGPKKLPQESILHSWKQHNPYYNIILWTDRPRKLEASYIEQRPIAQLFPLSLADEFAESFNWGEKSDILRYEILQRFGGIYADIDMECIQSIDPLTQNLHFFASAADVYPMVGHFIHVINSILGSAPGHPLIKRTLEEIQQGWRASTHQVRLMGLCDFQPEKTYTPLLVFKRTYIPLTKAILNLGLNPRDVVFPAHYFNYQEDPGSQPVYALNHSFKSWMPEKEVGSTIPVRQLVTMCYKLSFKLLALGWLALLASLSLALYTLWPKKLSKSI